MNKLLLIFVRERSKIYGVSTFLNEKYDMSYIIASYSFYKFIYDNTRNSLNAVLKSGVKHQKSKSNQLLLCL